jgi:SAM-dependent methyltransferase
MPDGTDQLGVVEPCPVCAGAATGVRRVDRAGEVAICGACGTWYRVPRPTAEELRGIYTQDYYNPWGVRTDASIAQSTKRATFATLLARLSNMIDRSDDGPKRLLDVGAATGLLMEMAEERGWESYGIELNAYSVGVLRDQFGPERVFEGELTACTAQPGTFHVITMTDVIEHVVDVPGTLRMACRLLRPNGVLCLTTPRVDSLSRCLMGRRWVHFKAEHVQYFTRRATELALGQAGFVEVEVRSHSKRISLDYLHGQLETFPHWCLTPASRVLSRVLPRTARRHPLWYPSGELVALARVAAHGVR